MVRAIEVLAMDIEPRRGTEDETVSVRLSDGCADCALGGIALAKHSEGYSGDLFVM
jgi:hypothetical protein